MRKGDISVHEIEVCGALLCENRKKSECRNKQLVLHRFPRDEKRCREWLWRAGRSDLKEESVESIHSNMALCENHFEKNCFYRLHCLRRDAMPSVFKHTENNIQYFDADSEQFDHMYCLNAREVVFKATNANNVSDSRVETGNPMGEDMLHTPALDEENDVEILNTCHEEIADFGDVTGSPWDKIPSQMCRLCASTNELHPKQSIDGWLSLLNEIIPDLVHLNDGLPQHICRPCAKRLYACTKVKSGFIEADKKLKETIGLEKSTNHNTEANNNSPEIPAQTHVQEGGNDSTSYPLCDGVGQTEDCNGEESEADDSDACLGTQYNKVKSEFAEAYEKLQLALGFVKSKSRIIKVTSRNSEVAAEIDRENNSIFDPLLDISEQSDIPAFVNSKQTDDETSKSYNIGTVNENSEVTAAAEMKGESRSVYYTGCYNSEQTGDFINEESKYNTETVNGNSEVVLAAQVESKNNSTYYPTFDKSKTNDFIKEESNECNFETANSNSEVVVAAQVESENSSSYYPKFYDSETDDFNNEESNDYAIETVNENSEVAVEAEVKGENDSLSYPVFENSEQTDDFNNESAEENTDTWTNMECVIDENNCMTISESVISNNSSVMVINRKDFKLFYPHRKLKYSCCECKKKFTFKKNFQAHKCRHAKATKDPEELFCKLCGKSFLLKYKLILHLNSHASAQPLICEYCGDSFLTISGFENHQLRHFPPSHTCSQCDKKFYTKTSLNVHIKTHLTDEKFVCHVCGKLLSSKVMLKVHLRSHLGEKPYQCTVCGKCYTSSCILKEHTCLYTLNSLTCDLCGKGFKRRRTLRNHINRHVTPKMHKCPICLRTFGSNADKLKHVNLCSRCITCVVCHINFDTIETMEEHRTEKHSVDEINDAAFDYRVQLLSRRRKCRFCYQPILGKSNMLKHIRKFHQGL